MKDFDFDELDKAVTSALEQRSNQASSTQNDTQTQPVADPSPQAQTQSVNQAQPVADPQADSPQSNTPQPINFRPVVDVSGSTTNTLASQPEVASQTGFESVQRVDTPPTEPQEVASEPVVSEPVANSSTSTADETANSTVETAAKVSTPSRRGRFMDMVHPSADMQTASAAPALKRTGINLSPLDASSAPVANNDVSSSSEGVMPPNTPTLDNLTRQEPLETSDERSEPEPTSVESDNTDDFTDVPKSAAAPIGGQPFIEGASSSVEKRPLGSRPSTAISIEEPEVSESIPESSNEAENTLETSEVSDLLSTNSSDEAASPEGSSYIPMEDSTAVFSQNSTVTPEAQAEVSQTEADPEVKDGEENKESESNPTPTEPSSSEATAAGGLAGPSPFIAQQYKTPEEKADDEEYGVFDTSNYHQPLTPAEPTVASKKHLVFWVILIIALFIGGGALGALYFLSLN